MFNVTVLKLRDIVKYFFGIVITILIIIFISKTFSQKTKEKKIVVNLKNETENISKINFLSCLDKTIPSISNINKEYRNISNEEDVKTEEGILKRILKTELSSIKAVEIGEVEKDKIEETASNSSEESNNDKETNTETVEEAKTGVKTEVITNNPISENYNIEYENVKIKNQTDYELTQDMLTPNITVDNKNVVIFHTHSCESYTSSEKYQYTPTGTYRTTDLNFTVTRVGTELSNQLGNFGYNVIHNTDYHDYPSYNGSYTRSLATVENILKTNPSDIVIDLHRDAVGSRSDYAPSVKIGEDVAAQIMFVIGTNGGGLWHPNWNENLKFAIKVQQKAEEMYPGLFKPIMLTNSRYNQHTAKYANIIEVGATGNTLEQCLTSMKYLAKVMSEL